jgi:probable phosphoglycerate mutase
MIAQYGYVDWDVDPDQPFSPGGESWVSMYQRVVAALTEVAGRHPGQLVIVATHGGVIEQAIKWTRGDNPGVRLQLRTEHCSMTELEIDEVGAPHLLRYNDRSPLAR